MKVKLNVQLFNYKRINYHKYAEFMQYDINDYPSGGDLYSVAGKARIYK